MARFSALETGQLRAMEHALFTTVEGAPHILAMLAEPLRELLRTDRVICYSLSQKGEGLSVDYFHTSGWEGSARAPKIFEDFNRGTSVSWTAYNPVRPEPAQQNAALRMCELGYEKRGAVVAPGLFSSLGLASMDQLRVLVCEGPSLLAWVGAFQPDPFDARQKRLLQRLVPAFKRRLSVDKRLGCGPLVEAALASALDAIGSAAFLISHHGHIVMMNAVAAVHYSRDAQRVAAALVDCARRPARTGKFVVTRVSARGCGEYFLAVACPDSASELTALSVRAAKRWGLSDRQRDVLALVADGLTNRVIAATLAISERTTEAHLTAIFEKAQVENRAELVARVWRA